MHALRKKEYRKKALQFESKAYARREKLDFENAGEYFYNALLEWLFINEQKEALRVLKELYRNSYAKICKYLLDEKWEIIPKMVERNIQGYNHMLKLVKNAEKYIEYFQYMADTILKAYRKRNIYILSNIIVNHRYLGELYEPLLTEITKQLKLGYAHILSIKEKFNIGYKATVNYIKILLYNNIVEGVLNNKNTVIYTEKYIKNIIVETLEQL